MQRGRCIDELGEGEDAVRQGWRTCVVRRLAPVRRGRRVARRQQVVPEGGTQRDLVTRLDDNQVDYRRPQLRFLEIEQCRERAGFGLRLFEPTFRAAQRGARVVVRRSGAKASGFRVVEPGLGPFEFRPRGGGRRLRLRQRLLELPERAVFRFVVGKLSLTGRDPLASRAGFVDSPLERVPARIGRGKLAQRGRVCGFRRRVRLARLRELPGQGRERRVMALFARGEVFGFRGEARQRALRVGPAVARAFRIAFQLADPEIQRADRLRNPLSFLIEPVALDLQRP